MPVEAAGFIVWLSKSEKTEIGQGKLCQGKAKGFRDAYESCPIINLVSPQNAGLSVHS